jgi:aspartyl/asparaginyl-tRNA synthetase
MQRAQIKAASLRWLLAGVLLCCTLPVRAESPITAWEGRPQVLWQDAHQVVGKTAFVSGKVVGVGASKTMRFIDFDDRKPARFQVVVNEKHWPAFSGDFASLYEGKLVRVRGLVTTYQERPQIQVTSPDQIEVLTELPNIKPIEA